MLRSLLVLFLAIPAVSFGQLEQAAPPEIDESLRATVNQFYSYFQRGRFREAEDLVDHESKDLYYDARKQRVISFELRQVSWSEDFREADVLVAASWVLPMLGDTPVPVPLSSNWRLVDGVWRLHLEPRPGAEDGGYMSPAGPMNFSDEEPAQLGSPAAMMSAPRPTIESLANMYEVSAESVTFNADAEGPQTQELIVQNKSRGSLRVELISESDGIEVAIEPDKFRAGEEAKVLLTYDSSAGAPPANKSLRFLVSPIGQRFDVALNFR